MTTITEAKDQAAREFGYEDYSTLIKKAKSKYTITELINRSLEIYAEAKAKEAYSQGVKDWEAANEKANKILDGLREKSKYVEAYNQGVRDAAESAEGIEEPDYRGGTWASVDKQSILKLLK